MSVQKTIATTDHHPIAWFSELQRREKNTFWACVGGWVLDAMDVQMFSFAIPAIIAVFAITNADAGLIGTATLLTSAFGGWFAGALSDRFGRVRTLQITIAWFAVFTFLCGFAQSYAQLFVFRALMGLGFGGEWAAGAVLIGEVIRAEHRGKAVGAMQSGWAIGWGIAALLATVFFTIFPQEIAWRVLFWVGLTPALLIFFLRRFVDEPPIFTQTRKNLAASGTRVNFLEIFSPSILKTTILTCAERPPAAWPLDWRIRHPRLWHSDLRGIAATRNARASADGRRALTLAARAVPEPNVLRPSARRSQTRRRLSPSGMLAKRKDVSSGSTRRSASALRSQQASRGSPTRARRASKPAPLSSTLDRHRSCLHPMCRADTCSTHAPFAEPTVVCETAMGPLVPTLAVSYI